MSIALVVLALITLAVVVDITRSRAGEEPPPPRDAERSSTGKIVVDLHRRS